MCRTGRRWDPDLPVDYSQTRRVWLSRLLGFDENTVVVEKSPPNLCRFSALVEAFDDMPTVSLVMSRNPFAVCASWAKRYRPETVIRTWHPELAGQGLEQDDLKFHAALGTICGQRFEMLREAANLAGIVTTYEEVAADPAAFIGTLLEILPLLADVDPTAAVGVKDYPEQSFRNMNEADMARLDPGQTEAIRSGLAPYADSLAHFGYSLSDIAL